MRMSNESKSFHCINGRIIVTASEGLSVEIWVQNSDPFIMLLLLFFLLKFILLRLFTFCFLHCFRPDTHKRVCALKSLGIVAIPWKSCPWVRKQPPGLMHWYGDVTPDMCKLAKSRCVDWSWVEVYPWLFGKGTHLRGMPFPSDPQ